MRPGNVTETFTTGRSVLGRRSTSSSVIGTIAHDDDHQDDHQDRQGPVNGEILSDPILSPIFPWSACRSAPGPPLGGRNGAISENGLAKRSSTAARDLDPGAVRQVALPGGDDRFAGLHAREDLDLVVVGQAQWSPAAPLQRCPVLTT